MYFVLETKEAPFISTRNTGLCPTPHMHTHIELVYLINGSSVCYADDKEEQANEGDIFLTFPNQIHYYRDIVPPKHCIFIFSAELCPDLFPAIHKFAPSRNVIRKSELPKGTEEAIYALDAGKNDKGIYAHAERKARLTLLMCSLLPLLDIKQHTKYDENLLKKIITYCYANYQGPISLESAERALGVNRCYISHLFRKKLNIGFNEYINTLRIQSACHMLCDGKKSITEIAYDSGFGTTRTFNRRFMEAKGKCPKEYREQHEKSKTEKGLK